MKQLMENWRRYTEEEELEEGRLSRAIAPFVIAAASIFGGNTASAAPQEPAEMTQELSSEQQAELKVAEKAYLYSIFQNLNDVQHKHLRQILAEASRLEIDTLGDLNSFLKGKISDNARRDFKEAMVQADKEFHLDYETKAKNWDKVPEEMKKGI